MKEPIGSKHFQTNIKKPEFYICVFVDIFSRFTHVEIIWNINSQTVGKALQNFLMQIENITQKILTDQGHQFTSSNFKNLLESNYIIHILTSPHNPTENSTVERVNLKIGLCLRLTRGKGLNELKKTILKILNFYTTEITDSHHMR
ncbi:putative uncharacterized transposon-derived protein F54H12.3 [Dictyocoela muelleri]|nr:putative uncharacterized transposon-derived protein F54H12.3 [Dictyocoela muelleri]